MPELNEWLLLAFIFWMALQLGGGLYEKQVIVPLWSKASPAQLQKILEQTGQKSSATRFWMFVSPFVGLLSLINLYVSWRLPPSSLQSWWMTAAGTSVFYSVSTYIYFVPQMLKMWKASSIRQGEVRRMLTWWTRLNYVRLLLGIIAFGSALGALRLVSTAF